MESFFDESEPEDEYSFVLSQKFESNLGESGAKEPSTPQTLSSESATFQIWFL